MSSSTAGDDQRRIDERLQMARRKPESGSYTGRCPKCGSTDLWDDNHACGCNNPKCDWLYIAQI